MRGMRSLLGMGLLLAFAVASAVAERHVVTFAPGDAPAVEAQLIAAGFSVALRGPGFFAVEPWGVAETAAAYAGAKEAARGAARSSTASSLLSLDGVTSAEADRIQASMDGNLTDAEASASHIAGAGGWLLESGQRGDSGPPVDCAARDKPLGYKPFPEIEAYHIPQVSLGQVYGT
ncbi:hypothetical protein MNEG_0770 [Monoraphidium neglectum]|uniref:SPOR domain-containing protein n=1 Tax=Monoraphidium neglectum TaxID=145388 RepID=A0A0D2MXI3_9CHLO|nr:hypothetical protein MNEG_0770 [Monoraphidium neglectum]KIZ07175.1 hypothetical protein MNEG_0770 [Monoraphidium neglectum]|eukprot:XP_013906194.1 hypothetical protein MNEG_0770 [Monoraphidium neglectum]